MKFIKKFYQFIANRIRSELRYRKNLKKARDDDPYIYK
jgi:hypothetical protein